MRPVALAVLVALPALAAPGEEWDITIELAMPGVPPGAVPPSKTRACGPKRSDAMPFNPTTQSKGCKVMDSKKTGSTWTWKLECEEGMSGSGSITLESAEAWSGESSMVVQGQSITSKMKGKLVGPCDYQGPPAAVPAPPTKGKTKPK